MEDENVQEVNENHGLTYAELKKYKGPIYSEYIDENGKQVKYKWTLRDKWRLQKKLRELEKVQALAEKQREEMNAQFEAILEAVRQMPSKEEMEEQFAKEHGMDVETYRKVSREVQEKYERIKARQEKESNTDAQTKDENDGVEH